MWKLVLFSCLSLASGFIFHGSTRPIERFDPFGFIEKSSENELLRYREAELKHSRWAMIGATAIPLIETNTHSPAIHAFDNLDDTWKTLIIGTIAAGEAKNILVGYENPFSLRNSDSYFKLKESYQPGDLGLNIVDHENENLANKELNNGRLAMIGCIGMIAQELTTNSQLF